MKSYKDLEVWQRAMVLAVEIYRVTRTFPRDELYGLTNQLRRSCSAIPSNIAEGQRRGHKAEYVQFLRIAYGSAAELETQLELAFRIGYLRKPDFDAVYEEIEIILKMLNRLIAKLLQPTT